MSEKNLNRVVRVRTGPGADMGLCLVQSYCASPTYGLVREDGSHFDWVAHFCEEATPDETAAYWRARAEKAEEIAAKWERTHDSAQALIDKLEERLEQRERSEAL